MTHLGHRAAYIAFDRFPGSKGSAVHIGHMAAELFGRFDGGLLGVLGGGGLPRYQRLSTRDLDDGHGRRPGEGTSGTVEIARFDAEIPNLIDRAEAFSGWVAAHLRPHLASLRVCHVRDPWGALPALAARDGRGAAGRGDVAGRGVVAGRGHAAGRGELAGQGHAVVYEANGLPSIEMTHTWPSASPAALAKIAELERYCLGRADAVVVPSEVIAAAVARRGVPDARIHLVRNGADVPAARPARPPDAPERYLVYVGALQPWQGVDVLLRAFSRLADLSGLRLVVCSSVPERRARPIVRLAERLGIAERVVWRFTLPHEEVAAWLAGAEVSVAPLTGCARNLDQGCAPLKVLESMAAGTPVVASDLPAVRELMTDGVHGRLVPADRPPELARALRVLLEYPDAARSMGEAARRQVAGGMTWADARSALADVYRSVAPGSFRSDTSHW